VNGASGTVVAQRQTQRGAAVTVDADDPTVHLHDERDRIVEHGDAKVHVKPADIPERRRGAEGLVPGDPGSVEELEIDPSLEACAAELPGDVRRGARAVGRAVKAVVTQFV
jgi:hypothetical protein